MNPYCAVAHVGELLTGPTNSKDCKTIVRNRLTWGSSCNSGQSCPQKRLPSLLGAPF